MPSPPGTKKRHGPSLDRKKEDFLDLIHAGLSLKDACHRMGMTMGTLDTLRKRDLNFDAEIKSVTTVLNGKGKYSIDRKVFDPDRPLPPKGTFAEFNRRYFGSSTYPHHQGIADACLSSARRVVILMPPGAGKDTTLGRVVLYAKADDRIGKRVRWIMESAEMGIKRVGERIEPFLTDPKVYEIAPRDTPNSTVPTSTLIKDYGPFKWASGMMWPDGTPIERPTWSKKEGYRFLQSIRAPEADADLQATGLNGSIYGSRIQILCGSDMFTRENQVDDGTMQSQLDFIKGTLNSRLDAKGVAWFIGTRVRAGDNYERLIDWLVPDGVEVFEQRQDGPLTWTRYTNGVVVVICQAIWTDENGDEHSYWEDRFPLDDKWEDERTGERWEISVFNQNEADERGLIYVQGLRSIRAADPELFETIYQQNPPASTAAADFTKDVLDLCDDPSRSYGVAHSHEELVLSVDPARTLGAAYVVLALDYANETITVVESWWGKKLGINGIKNLLLLNPASKWHPARVCYEGNHEQGIMFDETIQGALRTVGAAISIVRTGDKRNDPVVGVASIQREMRQGRIIFPTATVEDRKQTARIKQHFLNWEGVSQSKRRAGSHSALARPDDLCMAIANGVLLARQLFRRSDATPSSVARGNRRAPSRRVPPSIARRWKSREEQVAEQRGRDRRQYTRRSDPYHGVDVHAIVMSEWEG